jgi:inositol phosphorylceramide mannosyltransferase catalytic subunit
MIPKIIHHVWPGDDLFRERFHAWRESWLKFHPDWTFYFWRLDNLPSNINPDIKRAVLDPNFSVTPKSDMIRFEVVRLFGGVYVDTDMECLKPFDEFRNFKLFSGYEDDERRICPSLFGAEPNHPLLTQMAKLSVDNAFKYGYELANTQPHKYTSVKPFTKLIQGHLADPTIKIYSKEYFYPIYLKEKHRLSEETPNAYAKHHWTGNDDDGWTKQVKFA